MTKKQMRSAIKEKYAAIPDSQISVGVYLQSVRHKMVTILDTWEPTSVYKIDIVDFYNQVFC